MNATSQLAEKRGYRFDDFLADPVRRALLRGGETVAVTPKAVSILLVLLENHGRVVGKDELIRQVWASSYVSEANLTQNISSLRKALGERAGEGRYVVTVPGQGYCFAAPIELVEEEPHPCASSPAIPRAMPQVLPSPAEVQPEAGKPAAAGLGRHIALGLLVLAVTLALSWYLSRPARGPLPVADLGSAAPSRRPSVAVLGFRDLSRGSETRWIGTALAEMLATELDAGSGVRVISREEAGRARRVVEIETSGELAGDSLARVRAIGADRVVVGTYVAMADAPAGEGNGRGDRSGRDGRKDRRIRLDLRVIQGQDGDILASLAEVGRESELFDLVARAGARLRESLGYAAPSPEQARAARALQPSDPEALWLYSLGLERMRSYDAPHALEVLQQAAQADPRSPAIRSALSQALEMLGHEARARQEAQSAVALAPGLPREERLVLQARLQSLNQEWVPASEIYRSLWTFYPDDLEYGLQLANSLMRAGRAREAGETIAALRRLPPPQGEDPRIDILESRVASRLADASGQVRTSAAAVAKGRRMGEPLIVAHALVGQAQGLLSQGQTGPAIEALREAQRLAEEDGHPYVLGMALSDLGFALELRGDLDAAEKAHQQALAIAQRLGSSLGIAAELHHLGRLRQLRGELTEALGFLERSLSWQVRLGERLNEARTLDTIGLVLSARGDLDGARQRFERALEISREVGNQSDEAAVLSHLAQVLERQGELSEALQRHEQAFMALRQLGDNGRAVEALVESASALSRLGNPAGARRRLEHALRTYRRLGNRLAMAEVLDRLSGLAYRTGDLAASRRLSDLEMRIARETGSTALLGEALRRSGRTDWAMGRLGDARRAFARALSLRLEEGEEAEAMGIRLDLARLALSEESYDEADRLAREAAAWYYARGMGGNEAQAMSLLAEALLRQGRPSTAQQAAARAWSRAEASEDREMRVLVAARLARVDAAGGQTWRSIRELRRRIPEAQAAGYVNAVLQARLALGELLLAAGEAQAGRAALLQVRKEAEARGFALLALGADEALGMGGSGGKPGGWKG